MAEVWTGSNQDEDQPTEWAEMGSSGPWYDPIVRANCILGCRAVKSRKLRWQDVGAQIETRLRPVLKSGAKAPTSRSANKWESETPDYPEWALSQGLITKADLVPGVAAFVRESGPAVRMEQEQPLQLQDILVGAGLGWLGYKILKGLSNHRARTNDAKRSTPTEQGHRLISGIRGPVPKKRRLLLRARRRSDPSYEA
jgi:hypothetical protein